MQTLPSTYWKIIHETSYVHNADNMQASETVQHTYLGGSHRADNDRMAANADLEASLTSQEPWLLTSLKLHSSGPSPIDGRAASSRFRLGAR